MPRNIRPNFATPIMVPIPMMRFQETGGFFNKPKQRENSNNKPGASIEERGHFTQAYFYDNKVKSPNGCNHNGKKNMIDFHNYGNS